MRLSRASAYALSAVLQLAESEEKTPVPCSRLARSGELPERFLLQVLRNLVNHGLLKSTRGVEGGYYLERPVDEISLLEIIEATDGPLELSLPPLAGISESSRQQIRDVLGGVASDARERFSSLKLSDLKSAGPQHPVVTGLGSPSDVSLPNESR